MKEIKDENQSSLDDNIDVTLEVKRNYSQLLDIPNKVQHTPLFMAIIRGHLEIAQMLLDNDMSSIDCKDS